jgi:hypothetical protein
LEGIFLSELSLELAILWSVFEEKVFTDFAIPAAVPS